jgi:hypothetical protein
MLFAPPAMARGFRRSNSQRNRVAKSIPEMRGMSRQRPNKETCRNVSWIDPGQPSMRLQHRNDHRQGLEQRLRALHAQRATWATSYPPVRWSSILLATSPHSDASSSISFLMTGSSVCSASCRYLAAWSRTEVGFADRYLSLSRRPRVHCASGACPHCWCRSLERDGIRMNRHRALDS